jgi:hypothetical protein
MHSYFVPNTPIVFPYALTSACLLTARVCGVRYAMVLKWDDTGEGATEHAAFDATEFTQCYRDGSAVDIAVKLAENQK